MGTKGKANQAAKQPVRIGSKIMFADMAVIIIVSVVFSVLACLMSYKSTRDALEQAMGTTAASTAHAVQYKIGDYMTYTECIASTMRLYSDDYKPEEKVAYLKTRTENGKDDGLVEMMLCTADGNDISDGKNYSTDEGFKPTIGGKNYISSPYADASGKLVFDVWTPVWQGGKSGTTVVGALCATYSEDALIKLISEVTVSKNGAAYAVDASGTNIIDTNTDRIKTKDNVINNAKTDSSFASLAAVIQKAVGGQPGFSIYNYGGKKFAAYAPISDTNGWIVCVYAPLSDFMGTVYKTIIISVLLMIFFIIIGSVLVKKMVNNLNTPIGIIVDRLATFADGDVESPMPPVTASSLELISLAESTTRSVEGTSAIIKDIDYLLTELSHGNYTCKSANTDMYIGDYAHIL